ncbi:protein FAM234B-like isoform X2 [Haliotis asinina]
MAKKVVEYFPLQQQDTSDEDGDGTHAQGPSLDTEAKGPLLLDPFLSTPTRRRRVNWYAVVALVIISFGAIAMVTFVALTLFHGKGHTVKMFKGFPTRKSTPEWRVVLNATGSESCIRTPDIDGDGLPDVLVGLAHGADLSKVNSLTENNSLKKYCEQQGLIYPCVGFVLALRGTDGKELWRIPTRSEVMLMMCDIDVNLDGAKDCIVTGRQSTVQAVDLRKGKTLWFSDGAEYPAYFTQTWNVYQPVLLPDVDADGVEDIVVSHGGDPNIEPEVHNRTAGRLIILSGATGKPLGKYLVLPDSKETYMTPVKYTARDGSQYLLFGSGGETVPGDLMAIALPDLYTVTDQKVLPHSKGDFGWKKILPKYSDNNIMYLYRGKLKGVMVPPVIVDVDNDGEKDILVSAFDGEMVMLDGKTLTAKWRTGFPNMESYSTPAPGYFNDDNVLDFMVHWSSGAWPEYTSSDTLVLNGRNGKTLWKDRARMYQMSSDLVLRSMTKHLDYFMVKVMGKNATLGNGTRGQAHGVGAQRVITKRDSEGGDVCEELIQEFKDNHVTCDNDLTHLRELVYLVDRNHAKKTIPLHITQGGKYYYDYLPRPDEEGCMPADKTTGKIPMCIVMLPDSRSTDAVTDVDGDGRLDLIHLGLLEGRLRDSRFSYTKMKFTTIISRIDIMTGVNKHFTAPGSKTDPTPPFAPLLTQSWLQYLGSAASSIFYQHRI